jgi:four helix bundle protein
MDSAQFKKRTKAYALAILRLVRSLPRDPSGDVLAKQLLRSATSVGANYRAACRAKSPADFIAKMGIVEEEADESVYWLELLVDGGFVTAERVADLIEEGNQLTAMAVSSIRTTRSRVPNSTNARSTLREEPIAYDPDLDND